MPLKRPSGSLTCASKNEGIVDVTRIWWTWRKAFPHQTLSPADAKVLSAKRSTTALTPAQFKQVTGTDTFPITSRATWKDGALQVFSNGEFTYQLRGIHAKISVIWNLKLRLALATRTFPSCAG